jgi:hypothetical protein
VCGRRRVSLHWSYLFRSHSLLLPPDVSCHPFQPRNCFSQWQSLAPLGWGCPPCRGTCLWLVRPRFLPVQQPHRADAEEDDQVIHGAGVLVATDLAAAQVRVAGGDVGQLGAGRGV